MNYLKVWTSFREAIAPLNDAEKGRLFDAMLIYAETGEEPTEFKGNERFLWAVAKQDIDRTAQKCETLKANASKGGIAKSKNQQELANCSKDYQSVADDSKAEQIVPEAAHNIKKYKEKKSKEIYNDDDNRAREENDLIRISEEQNRMLDSAEDAGFQRTNTVRAKLIDLYSLHGMEKMMAGINSCVTHGAVNLAYLEAVLRGEPKKTKAKVPAQDYQQRDYSGEDDAALERMMARGQAM